MSLSDSDMPILTRLIAAGLAVSEKSAKCVQRIFDNGNLKIVDKGGLKNCQTQADREIEQLVVGNIEKYFPGVAIGGGRKNF